MIFHHNHIEFMQRWFFIPVGIVLMTCVTPSLFTGTVSVVGSAPRNLMLVLTTDVASYQIVGDLSKELWNYQGLKVSVRGIVVHEARGPGFPAQLEVEYIELPNESPAELSLKTTPGDKQLSQP